MLKKNWKKILVIAVIIAVFIAFASFVYKDKSSMTVSEVSKETTEKLDEELTGVRRCEG